MCPKKENRLSSRSLDDYFRLYIVPAMEQNEKEAPPDIPQEDKQREGMRRRERTSRNADDELYESILRNVDETGRQR